MMIFMVNKTNTLNGGSGNDRLTVGEGFDLQIGGPGDDTYIIDDERDTIDDQGLDTDMIPSSSVPTSPPTPFLIRSRTPDSTVVVPSS